MMAYFGVDSSPLFAFQLVELSIRNDRMSPHVELLKREREKMGDVPVCLYVCKR